MAVQHNEVDLLLPRDRGNLPFLAKTDSDRVVVNHYISEVLNGTDAMINRIAHGILRGFNRHDIEDAVQECKTHLWQKSLPTFNTDKHTKVSTFVFTCAHRFMLQVLRRPKPRTGTSLNDDGKTVLMSDLNNVSMDRKIEHLARDVIAHPERYLSPQQARVFKKLIGNRERMRDISRRLNYSKPSSLSMMKRRIIDRLLEIDLEEIPSKGPATKASD